MPAVELAASACQAPQAAVAVEWEAEGGETLLGAGATAMVVE